LRNFRARRPFLLYADETHHGLVCAAGDAGGRVGAGAADRGNPDATDCAATAADLEQLRRHGAERHVNAG